LSQFNYFGPRNFTICASYYTEMLLYSNFRGPLFSRTCQAREIREIKGTRKKRVLQYQQFIAGVTNIVLTRYEIQQLKCTHVILTGALPTPNLRNSQHSLRIPGWVWGLCMKQEGRERRYGD